MTKPAWWDTAKNRSQQATSARQERKLAEDLGGKRQPGSGSQVGAKGDVRSDDDLVEMKFTNNASYNLRVADLIKILREAERAGRDARFIVDFPLDGIRCDITVERLR